MTLHVVLLAGLVRATTARRCRTLSRMSSVSSAARLRLEIGCHPIQVRNHPAQAVALATNRADLLLLLAQPLGSPAHRQQRDCEMQHMREVIEDLAERDHIWLQLRRLDLVQALAASRSSG